jgi:hypothetical protein
MKITKQKSKPKYPLTKENMKQGGIYESSSGKYYIYSAPYIVRLDDGTHFAPTSTLTFREVEAELIIEE